MGRLAVDGGAPVWTEGWPLWPMWDDCERHAVASVIESGRWQAGEQVQSFEREFASYQGAKHGICVTNGTASLEVALRALGVGLGDEVIVPAYTFAATGLAVMTVGAVPVIVDIDQWLNINPAEVEKFISPCTKAIIPVHVGGIPVDMDSLGKIASRHGLAIIEDAAHAHGSEWKGCRVGAIGDVGSFSFQSGKCMTSGDGGILLTNDDDLAKRIRLFREFGRVAGEDGLDYLVPGSNERLTEFQAAILRCQLNRLDDQIGERRRAVEHLRGLLNQVRGVRVLDLDRRVTRWSVYILPVWVDPEEFSGCTKSELIHALRAEGIPAEAGYNSLSELTVFKDAAKQGRCRCAQLPVTLKAVKNVLWLTFPCFMNGLRAVEAIAEAFEKVQRHSASLKERVS